ncbi:hypothetical protein NE562_00735 [Butyricicoccus faecihominis]|nr:hypothetical protein [Butyricicoccus faecihominis]MCQ5128166.1 hypothetical protein [Butyricicoccus faecihominis]
MTSTERCAQIELTQSVTQVKLDWELLCKTVFEAQAIHETEKTA